MMALEIESVDTVDFIVGPGNAYVAEAKRQLNLPYYTTSR
jgi:sulfopropanediol 3-dehydrogenase